MPVSVRTHSPLTGPDAHRRIGDVVGELARQYAAIMNGSAFGTALRTRQLPRRRYLSLVSTMYPIVVGFNRALIRSIAKVDHVRHSAFVKTLAEQLHEEQAHNQLWRTKLDAYRIDHEALYGALGDYLAAFSNDELDRMTRDVLTALTNDIGNTEPGVFPDPVFPEPILALYHHLWMTASSEAVNYWEHFACQSGIEMVIFDVVSTSILPGVLGNSDLDEGPATTQWWLEHGRVGTAAPGERIDEEKHLELSRIALNRSETANLLRGVVATRAEDAMRLFAGTFTCQDTQSERFPLEKYLKHTRSH
jgi:hypothetical protein